MIKEKIHYSGIKIYENFFEWRSIKFKHLLFCEGVSVMQNPWFKWLPFKPDKGECLIIELPGLDIKYVLKRDIIIIPLNKHLYWAGATHKWDSLTNTPTEKAKNELQLQLGNLLKNPYKIIDHKAAIRPSMRDRAPVIGAHPQFKNMFVFNGMGTKGALLAPWYAQVLFNHIYNQQSIPSQVDVQRFYRHHTE